MADFEIKSPAEFVQALRKLETTDRGHADVFNALFAALLNNDVFLKGVLEELALTSEDHESDTDIHVTAEDKQGWNTDATQTAAGRMSAADKTKLDSVAAGAEVNQNAYAKVKAGSIIVEANGKTSQIEIAAGSNITITGDNANKKITITANLPATMTPSAHTQSASTITAGTFAGNVAVKAGTDYTTSRLRNVKMQSSAPSTLANGDICLVYS